MAVQLILKNSSVEDKRPTDAQLATGEISLNYNATGAFLCCTDTDGNVHQVGGVKISATPPENPVRQTQWFEPASLTLYIHDGTNWLPIAGGGGGGGTGDITTIIGNDGINASEIAGIVTLNVDLAGGDDGLEFKSGALSASVATASALGSVKVGTGIDVTSDGTISIDVNNIGLQPDEIIGGDGIEVTPGADDVTVSVKVGSGIEFDGSGNIQVAVDNDRGIELTADGIAAKLGAGLSFDGDGKIQSDVTGGVKGTVDVTGSDFPASAQDSEFYVNVGDGNFSSAWAAVTTNADETTVAAAGDLLLYQAGNWEYVPTGGTVPGTDLDIDNRTAFDLEVTSTTGEDATIPAATASLAGLMTAADKVKVDAIGDGQLIINDSDGNEVGTFTANQATGTDTTITLPEGFSGDYDDLANKPTIGDGELKIEDADGTELGTFKANQEGPSVITLPAGFSGDYDDLANQPTIGDGTITLKSDGTEVGTFTVNQTGDTEIDIPAASWGDVTDKPIYIDTDEPGSPTNGDIWVDLNECPPELKIWSDCSGTGQWETIEGTPPITFDVSITDSGADGNVVGQTLTAVAANIAGGTAPVEVGYQWYADGTPEASPPGSQKTKTILPTDVGKTITCDITVAEPDGSGAVTKTATYAKTIGNPLEEDVATVIAGVAETGATLTATPGTAKGGTDPISYSATRWQTSADGTSGWADLPGATGNTYVIQGSDLNNYLRAVTTATDSTTPTAQTLDLPSIASAKVTAPAAVTLGWNADTDVYTRDPAANRIIDVHVRIRRCLLTDAGVPTYLDADDSTKLAGDWLRLCETTELNTPYTGTHGAEVANTALRAAAPAWSAGTYTKGQRVTNGGSVWECIVASTTAPPAAGTAAATLTGATAQVMVEIPRFSVWHETAPAGSYQQHTFHLARGTKVDGGYAVHPAFIKPDNSYRDFIYVGAYQGTGTNGNGSASGVNNTVNMTRAACRTACSGRGAGWHQLGYWENNALQWLLITEYQDMNSQKVLGNGAMAGSVYVVPTGLSNARGNRSGNAHTPAGANSDYVSYRGVENFYGRAWQWIDGINVNDLAVYLSSNPAQWADDTATNYTASGSVPSGSGSYQRDVMNGIALLPSSVTGASDTTFTGDALWTNSGWRVAYAGGRAGDGARVGALCVNLRNDSSDADASISGRLAYAA